VADLFAGRGVTESIAAAGNAEGLAALLAAVDRRSPGLIFATLVDFDTLYGHRNDAPGFARALAELDAWLPRLRAALAPDDLWIVTADHGNDPTTPGTDHTRELVLLFAIGEQLRPGAELGTRDTCADVAATVAGWLGVPWEGPGTSFRAALTPASAA
jgi:phosphopentomutase